MEHAKNIKPVLLVFALSNMAALIYQISWAKSLSYVFGTSVYAIGTVLACFMAGLALGSFVLGKKADRSPNPLRLFAYVEIALGMFALFLIPVFAFLPQPYASLHRLFEGSSILNLLLFALSFQVLIIPASLIGGTFPIMNRIYASINTVGKDVGVVYSADTVFAAIGALLAGFVLLPMAGISRTIAIAAVINILSGIYLYKKSGETGTAQVEVEKRNESVIHWHEGAVAIVFVSFLLSGFAALAAEVVWIRFLSLTLGTSMYSLAIITASFLVGLSLGSFLAGKYIDKMQNPLTIFAFVELCIGFSAIVVLLLLNELDTLYLTLYHVFDSFYPFTLSLFMVIFLIMLIPTTLMGATMPLVSRIVSNKSEYIGTDTGAVYTVNTFGAIFGTLSASFILIPSVGIIKTGVVGAAISISIGLLIFSRSEKKWKNKFFSIAAVSVVSLLYLSSSTINPLSAGAYYHGTQLKDIEGWKSYKQDTELVHFEEGLYGMVSVVKKDRYTALRIDGKSESSNVPIELVSEHQLAYIPLFAGNSPKKVMLIGLGGGFTLDAITNFEEIESIELVEINPQIVKAAKEYFSSYTDNALYDTRVKVIIEDGRNNLAASDERYDVIISQPSNIWLSGEGGLFTKEMYEIAKEHLNEGGIFGQWMPLYEQDADDFRIFLATFSSVFPYTDLWVVGYDAVLVGSMQPVEYDYWNIRSNLDSNYKLSSDFEMMSDVLVTSGKYSLLYQTMIPYRMSGVDVKEFSGDAINTDDHPVLEFSSARNTIYQQKLKKPFEALDGYLKERYDLILSPPFKNLTARNANRVNLSFIDMGIGLDDAWKEVIAEINVDHPRNVIYMEAVYTRGNSQLSILAFPLPDQPLTTGMKENIMSSMTANAKDKVEAGETVINGHWGYEVESHDNYAVSWFCEHNDIVYSMEIRYLDNKEAQEIIKSVSCGH